MSKAEQVYKYLKEKILANELNSGESISISDIATELAMSKIPVREGLRKLEAVGLVELIPNVGARVKKLDLDELEQLMLIRRELETLAASLAAEKIDKATIKKLYKMVDLMEREVDAGREKEYSQINREFHMLIYRSSKANIIVDLIEELWDRSERSRWVFKLFPARFLQSNIEHRQIVEGLERRDSECVAALIRKQKSEGFMNVIRFLKEYEQAKNS